MSVYSGCTIWSYKLNQNLAKKVILCLEGFLGLNDNLTKTNMMCLLHSDCTNTLMKSICIYTEKSMLLTVLGTCPTEVIHLWRKLDFTLASFPGSHFPYSSQWNLLRRLAHSLFLRDQTVSSPWQHAYTDKETRKPQVTHGLYIPIVVASLANTWLIDHMVIATTQ